MPHPWTRQPAAIARTVKRPVGIRLERDRRKVGNGVESPIRLPIGVSSFAPSGGFSPRDAERPLEIDQLPGGVDPGLPRLSRNSSRRMSEILPSEEATSIPGKRRIAMPIPD